jgi:hypothetical protein
MTPEEQKVLAEKVRGLHGWDAAEEAWEAGYEARKVRERESFASNHGERCKAVIRALLAVARVPNLEDVAILRRASEFLDELEVSAIKTRKPSPSHPVLTETATFGLTIEECSAMHSRTKDGRCRGCGTFTTPHPVKTS